MNIIDLTYCLFYRHDEKHDIGFPPIGAVAGLAFILGLYLVYIFHSMNKKIVRLENIRSAYNVGNVIRTADAL